VRLSMLSEWSILLNDVVCGEHHFNKESTSRAGVHLGEFVI
jgi:hypothetical protein